MSEITCLCRIGEKTLAIHTPARSFLLMPLLLKFNGDLDMEEWQADISAGKSFIWTEPDYYSCLNAKDHPEALLDP